MAATVVSTLWQPVPLQRQLRRERPRSSGDCRSRVTASGELGQRRGAVSCLLLAVVVLTSAGCVSSTDAPSGSAARTPSAEAGHGSPATPRPQTTGLPQRASHQLSTAELDAAAEAAEAAYRTHRRAYDSAAGAGYADEEALEALLATAGPTVRDAILREAAHMAERDIVVSGEIAVTAMAGAWYQPPTANDDALMIAFDTCIDRSVSEVLHDGAAADGYRPPGEDFLLVEMLREDGAWLVWSQQIQGDECP